MRAWLFPGGALLALYGFFYLQFGLQLLGIPYELDQGEGYDVWSAWLTLQGSLPYTDNQRYPYYSSNYPPLWSVLVAIPMSWLGPGLASGRLVSLASTLLAALVIALAAYRLAEGDREDPSLPAGVRSVAVVAGVLAALLFLGSPYVFHTTPLARVNATALFFALLGLLLLGRQTVQSSGAAFQDGGRGAALMGCLALLAAVFTKPTAMDAVAAGLAALLIRDVRLGVKALAGLVGVGLIGLAFLNGATQGAFWVNVVAANANPFQFDELAKYLANLALTHGILLALAISELWRRWQRGDRSAWVLYLPIAAVASLGVGKWGAGESYFLGLVAASSVLAGCAIVRLTGSLPPSLALPLKGGGDRFPTRAVLLSAALVVHALVSAHGPLSDLVPFLADRGRQAEFLGKPLSPAELDSAAAIVATLRVSNGPVLSEAPSFVIVAGKPVVGNATHLRNLYQAGLWDPANLVTDLRDRRFGAVILNAQLFPAPVLDAIGQSYALDRTVSLGGQRYRVLLPRRD